MSARIRINEDEYLLTDEKYSWALQRAHEILYETKDPEYAVKKAAEEAGLPWQILVSPNFANILAYPGEHWGLYVETIFGPFTFYARVYRPFSEITIKLVDSLLRTIRDIG